MNIFYNITEVNKSKDTVLTIGTFDGFHVGHRKIIDFVIRDSKEKGCRSFVITFEPHPRIVVNKNYEIKLLTTLDEKIKLLQEAGIENLLVVNFTPEFSKLTYDEFFDQYIISKIGIRDLVIGHDHHLGKNREGDENKLKRLGSLHSFDVKPVDAMKIDDEIVNSTKVRKALTEGRIDLANNYLGRYYSFSGKVVNGAMRGRELGFPTANIDLNNENKLIPANGIYLVKILVRGSEYFGLMSAGLRPTFGDTDRVLIEVYILDFNQNIYDEEVTVKVVNRIRDELKFASKEELISQMNLDKQKGLEIINNLIN